GQVQLRRGGAGQPDDAEAEPVLAPVGGLLHQVAALQHGQQPERRRLVYAQFAGHLGDPGLAAPGQDLQHGDRTVDRLYGSRLARNVAHGETIPAPRNAEGQSPSSLRRIATKSSSSARTLSSSGGAVYSCRVRRHISPARAAVSWPPPR